MANTYKVQLGPNAYSFNDQSTGISLARGEVKELTARQYSTLRVQKALRSGHLSLVVEAIKAEKYSQRDIEKLTKKLQTQHEKGMEVSKVAKGYTLEEITLVAKDLGFEVEPNDTIESLLTSIFEEFASNDK